MDFHIRPATYGIQSYGKGQVIVRNLTVLHSTLPYLTLPKVVGYYRVCRSTHLRIRHGEREKKKIIPNEMYCRQIDKNGSRSKVNPPVSPHQPSTTRAHAGKMKMKYGSRQESQGPTTTKEAQKEKKKSGRKGKDTSYSSCPPHSANRTEPARCRKRLQYSGTVYRIPQRQLLFRVVAQKKRIIIMALLPFTEPAIPQRNCYPPPH